MQILPNPEHFFFLNPLLIELQIYAKVKYPFLNLVLWAAEELVFLHCLSELFIVEPSVAPGIVLILISSLSRSLFLSLSPI